MSKDHLILGCPGSGKTRSLIDIAVKSLNNLDHPIIELPHVWHSEKIAYVSFTRKAALEGATRIKQETGGEGF